MKISRILHAGYVFESGATQIIFDPIFENPFSRNCFSYPAVQFDYQQIIGLTPSAIFISHYHDDHCSFESLQHLNRQTPLYVYCHHEEIFDLLRELGFKNVVHCYTDESVIVGAFEVIPRLALDADVDSIFQIKAEDLNILNVVDAWIDPAALKKLAGCTWDMVLWPFQTMRETEVIAPELALPAELPQEWLEQLEILNPRYIVPSSCQFIHEEWSWYRKSYFPISYRRFQTEVEAYLPSSKVYRMNPGMSVELTKTQLRPAVALPWVLPMGPQDVDYDYDPQAVPALTSEVAKHFCALTEDQKQHVLDFCKKDLIEKYLEFNPEWNAQWKLVLYDHKGESVCLCYQFQNGQIKILKEVETAWVTEVPIAKVFAALEEGEALSSMYLRMRGMPFDNIFEDPLVATLFSGDYFSYQKNQLKKIISRN